MIIRDIFRFLRNLRNRLFLGKNWVKNSKNDALKKFRNLKSKDEINVKKRRIIMELFWILRNKIWYFWVKCSQKDRLNKGHFGWIWQNLCDYSRKKDLLRIIFWSKNASLKLAAIPSEIGLKRRVIISRVWTKMLKKSWNIQAIAILKKPILRWTNEFRRKKKMQFDTENVGRLFKSNSEMLLIRRKNGCLKLFKI